MISFPYFFLLFHKTNEWAWPDTFHYIFQRNSNQIKYCYILLHKRISMKKRKKIKSNMTIKRNATTFSFTEKNSVNHVYCLAASVAAVYSTSGHANRFRQEHHFTRLCFAERDSFGASCLNCSDIRNPIAVTWTHECVTAAWQPSYLSNCNHGESNDVCGH